MSKKTILSKLQRNHPTIAFIALCLGFFMTILDVTIVVVALVNIKHHLGASVPALQWIVDGYALAFASILLTAGAIGDRIGNKRIFLGGLALFTAASVVAALSPTLWMLEFARVVQGLGAALLVPSSLALISLTFPDEKKKTQALGIYGSIGGLGGVVGPLLGGFLVDAFGWQSIFIINIPIGIVCFLLTFYFVSESQKTPQRGFDIPGQLLGILALSMLTLTFIQAKEWGWRSLPILGAFTLFILAAVTFLFREHRTTSPMLPLSLFHNRTFSGASMVSFIIFFALYGELFIMNLFFQQIKNYSPTMTGLAFLPQGGIIFFGSFLAGKLAGKIGIKLPMIAGLLFGIIGVFGLTFVTATTSYFALFGILLAVGLSLTLALPSLTTAVVTNAPKEDSGIASSVYNTTRQIGSVLGIAILGSLLGSHNDFVKDMHLAFLIAGVVLFFGLLITIFTVKNKN